MLEDLHKINWHELEAGYENGEKVPALIEKIAFGTESECLEAEEALTELLVHQGTTWSATTAAIPFLLEILPNIPLSHQVSVMGFLNYASSSRDVLTPESENWLTLDEVVKGYEIYLSLLLSPHGSLKIYAIGLFGGGKRFNSAQMLEFTTQFLTIVATEKNLFSLLSHLQTLDQVMVYYPEVYAQLKVPYLELLTRYAESSKDLSRYFASVYLLKRLGDAVSADVKQKVLATATEQLVDLAPEEEMFMKLGVFSGISYIAIEALEQLSPPNYIEAMMPILQSKKERQFKEFIHYIILFLQNLFNENLPKNQIIQGYPKSTLKGYIFYEFPVSPNHRAIADLTKAQKEALRTILSIDAVWKEKHNLLEMYGIQESADELRKILK